MTKKFAALLLIVLITAVGCGAKENKPASPQPEAVTGSETEKTENEEPAVEEVPAAEDPGTTDYVKEDPSENDDGGITEAQENGRIFTLYSLSMEEVAEITVPEFMPETYYTEVALTAEDEMTYAVSYMAALNWDTDKFFEETMYPHIDFLKDDGAFTSVEPSDLKTVTVNGMNAKWKKVTAVYDGDISYAYYTATIDYDHAGSEHGVVGITFSATGVTDGDERLMEVLSGITLK